MSETPRTDDLATRRAHAIGRADLAVCWQEMSDLSRQLERELEKVRAELLKAGLRILDLERATAIVERPHIRAMQEEIESWQTERNVARQDEELWRERAESAEAKLNDLNRLCVYNENFIQELVAQVAVIKEALEKFRISPVAGAIIDKAMLKEREKP